MKTNSCSSMKRLAATLILAAAMVMPQTVLAVGTQPSGSGTTSSPYQIATPANLLWFADQVNTGNNNICAKLTADITLSGETSDYMIGTKEYGFKGEFDGQGHTIRGVNVTTAKTGKNSYKYAGGLFGCIDVTTSTPAVVKNVTVEGSVNITGLTTHYYIGGVIAIAWGYVNISNVVSKVNVTTTSNGSYSHCGGVLASVEWFEEGNYKNYLTMSNCVNYGTLNVACGDICGGVVGYVRNGSITDCLNAGDITNSVDCYTCGVLGYTNDEDCTMKRCLNVGTITNTINSSKAYTVYFAKNNNIGAVSDLYYKSGTAASMSANTTAKSDANLKSGSLGYIFASNGWGQSIGNNRVNDAYPIPNKTDYKVDKTGSNYYNNITSTIPTGNFTTTIETTAQYISNQTRIGDTKSFNVTANAGKYITTVKYNGTTLTPTSTSGNVKTYSYTVALTNTFEITTANIACSTTLGQSNFGTAINLEDNTVGSTETFTVTPKAGYYITGATINGESKTGSSVSGQTNGTKSFSFTVKESNAVVINTAAIPCTTTLNQSDFGTAINLSNNMVGSTETFTVTPKAGYYITGATINGESKTGSSVSGQTNGTKSFSFTVKESNTVVINTAAIPCTTTLDQSTFGTAINLTNNTIGSTETFSVTPKAGYYIKNASINGSAIAGTSIGSNGTKSISFTVKESNTVVINTAAIPCTTTLNQSTSTLDLANNQIGSTETFTVTPKAGYYITGATINGESVSGTDTEGQTNGTKLFSFTVQESNTVIINTAAIGYSKHIGSGFTTNLPDNLNNKQIGDTVNFTVKPTVGDHKADVSYNDILLTSTSTDPDGTCYYSFVVAEKNVIDIVAESCDYINGFCTVCAACTPATLNGDYYEISNAGQLYWFAEQVNSGQTGINARLTADIVVNENVLTADGELNGNGEGLRVWTPIGNDIKGYYGTFDGQGYTISGLYHNDGDKNDVGLFGYNASDAKITNVSVVDTYFRGNCYIGGVCGYSIGTITSCYNTGVVSGKGSVGGVCGYNFYGTLTNCYNTGEVSGQGFGAGVCGYNFYGTLTNCHNTGEVSGSYNGVCGCNLYGTITNCYYLKDNSSIGIGFGSGEATEKTAEQFAAGEVAWLLNGSAAGESPVWRQTIGEDDYPVLDAAKGFVLKATPNGLNSIVRPTAGSLVGVAAVYNFAGIYGEDVYGVRYHDALAACHPYLFTTDSLYVSFVPSEEEVIDDTETFGLTGVLEADGQMVYGMGNTAGEGVSIVFTASAMKYANPKGNRVKYGKCYVKASEAFVSSVPLMASPLPAALEGVTTGIDGLEAPEANGKCYNLMGIEVGEDYRGIVICNGKKILRQ